MRNDPQNPGSDAKSRTQGRQQAQERAPSKQSAPVQGKDSKIRKGKTGTARDDDRNPGRSH